MCGYIVWVRTVLMAGVVDKPAAPKPAPKPRPPARGEDPEKARARKARWLELNRDLHNARRRARKLL
jgi:hypothetical protein